MNKFTLTAAAVLLQVALMSASQAADIANGKKIVTEHNCASCHGVDMKTSLDPSYPKLAGQHMDYLVHSIHAYQNDDKPLIGRQHAVMGTQAKSLSRSEIDDIAAYISSLPGDLVLEK